MKDTFARRHIGVDEDSLGDMLKTLGIGTLDELIDKTVPASIRSSSLHRFDEALSEQELLAELRRLGALNKPSRSFLGLGYSDCVTPPVIQRNILENPAWYTHYTPYQSEISQGRLEALINFQTMVIDLTGMEIANASLLDEGTAAAEAMAMMFSLQAKTRQASRFFVGQSCHPQTIAVVNTRAWARGWEIVIGDPKTFDFDTSFFGALIQVPDTEGLIWDYEEVCAQIHAAGAKVAVAADPLSLALLKPPAECGADVAVGSTQRLGMPMGYGGPHAAYFATREEFKRLVPGRIIGVTTDVTGKLALRMALQTREQHIRREKATSNICTAQVLPAVVSSMYAVYHGTDGLRRIARRIHALAVSLATRAERAGLQVVHEAFFDTLAVRSTDAKHVHGIVERASKENINLRKIDSTTIGISLDEVTDEADIDVLGDLLGGGQTSDVSVDADRFLWDRGLSRVSPFLTHPVFSRYRSETEMLRYMRRLDARDLSLTVSMIPLGSCTMKLNGTAEMMPVTWPEFARVHPFAPPDQSEGYAHILSDLSEMLVDITGLAAVSMQPNAGSQGEFSGLLAVRQYHESRGDAGRRVCLIPASAHGTNPASAIIAGFDVVVVSCDEEGNVNLDDLHAKAEHHASELGALMITYPSTHGVFEEQIAAVCSAVHDRGGLVYMDGANMNAMVGLCRPGELGVDVCHLNLHKTFCIPHGGGGPGMGPIAVASHLIDFLPSHPIIPTGGDRSAGPVASAPFSSGLILTISWAYLKLMAVAGLEQATKVAILNANYIARRLEGSYPILFRGTHGFVAHEAILDLRGLTSRTGIGVEDVAKRLMDYGFHAPTVHFPVAGTLMVEPTESECKEELDRFCDAMVSIREEIAEVERGGSDGSDNVLKNAPHTIAETISAEWSHPYSREQAVMPAAHQRDHKYWPPVARVDNTSGDRNLVCSCPPIPTAGADDLRDGLVPS